MIESIVQFFRRIFVGSEKSAEGKVSSDGGALEKASGPDGPSPEGAEGAVSRPRRRRPRSRRKRKNGAPEARAGFGSPGEALETRETEPWDVSSFEVPPEEGKTRFHDLDLPAEVMRGIYEAGYKYCTPIQAELLPRTLTGSDAAGRAQTGTGKTAVFLITILSRFCRGMPLTGRRKGTPRALVLAPTRELVLQIEKDAKSLGAFTPYRVAAVFGGMDYEKQRRILAGEPIDIVAATPGRLLDFQRQGDIHLEKVEILVIDEADRMLDMGFIPDVQKIILSTPPKSQRQTMLFSATLTPEVTRFASRWTLDPSLVEIEPEQVAVDTVDQVVYITTMEEKFAVLYNLIAEENLDRVIVFSNRRDQARRLQEQFDSYGISCALLSGEVHQKKRVKVLEDFRAGKIRVLVATDVAARGLHVEGVSHVVNFNLPYDPEDYVHRIGRTGRAGATGISVSFASEEDSFQIPAIEKLLGHELPCIYPKDEWLTVPPPPRSARSANTPRRSFASGSARRGGMRRR